MKTTLRIGSTALYLLAVIPLTTNGASGPTSAVEIDRQYVLGHLSRLTARITMRDGGTRTFTLEGVGCLQSICSRTAIKAKAEGDSLVRTWFDSLAAIQDTTASDALFVQKDGTSRRMSLINDFRVLYLANRLGGTEKLDLAKVKAVEFLAAARKTPRT
jgi:hypothetical protein